MPARPSLQQLERQIADRLDDLQRELGPNVPPEQLTALGRYHTDRLLAGATITEFIPQLVYRAAKEDIVRTETVAQTLPEAA